MWEQTLQHRVLVKAPMFAEKVCYQVRAFYESILQIIHIMMQWILRFFMIYRRIEVLMNLIGTVYIDFRYVHF